MQKQQDMTKAHWLLKPTLVGGCHCPLPALTDARSGGVVPTRSLSTLPKNPNSTSPGAGDSPTTPA